MVLCSHVVNASGLSWNAGDMDFTGGQMVLTLKLISMAVCFQDAHSKDKEVGGSCVQPLHLPWHYVGLNGCMLQCAVCAVAMRKGERWRCKTPFGVLRGQCHASTVAMLL